MAIVPENARFAVERTVFAALIVIVPVFVIGMVLEKEKLLNWAVLSVGSGQKASKFFATVLKRVGSILLPGNCVRTSRLPVESLGSGAALKGSKMPTVSEKSPLRCLTVGMVCVFDCPSTRRSPS